MRKKRVVEEKSIISMVSSGERKCPACSLQTLVICDLRRPMETLLAPLCYYLSNSIYPQMSPSRRHPSSLFSVSPLCAFQSLGSHFTSIHHPLSQCPYSNSNTLSLSLSLSLSPFYLTDSLTQDVTSSGDQQTLKQSNLSNYPSPNHPLITPFNRQIIKICINISSLEDRKCNKKNTFRWTLILLHKRVAALLLFVNSRGAS